VRHLVTESTTFLFPEAGRITLGLEALRVSADPDLTVVTYVAEPGSPSALRLQAVLEREARRVSGQARLNSPAAMSEVVSDPDPMSRYERKRWEELQAHWEEEGAGQEAVASTAIPRGTGRHGAGHEEHCFESRQGGG
jgi:hypothetical protein